MDNIDTTDSNISTPKKKYKKIPDVVITKKMKLFLEDKKNLKEIAEELGIKFKVLNDRIKKIYGMKASEIKKQKQKIEAIADEKLVTSAESIVIAPKEQADKLVKKYAKETSKEIAEVINKTYSEAEAFLLKKKGLKKAEITILSRIEEFANNSKTLEDLEKATKLLLQLKIDYRLDEEEGLNQPEEEESSPKSSGMKF